MREFASSSADRRLLELACRTFVAMLFAAVLAFLAPFGTYSFDAIGRVGYWSSLMASWLVLSLAAYWLVWQVPGLRSRGDSKLRVIAFVLAILPMMVVAGVASNMMTGWLPYAEEVTELFIAVVLLCGGCTYLGDRMVERVTNAHSHAVLVALVQDAKPDQPGEEGRLMEEGIPGEGPTDTALIDRLPAHVRGEILCMQVEDHYVRVHSHNSSALVLMRFSDALRGIDHIPGSQVHRSWWVATDAVTRLRKTGRTAQLTLINGVSVPVSQPYLAQATNSWGLLGA
ncbi:LytTR family DNA-binding domain-containing protein [Sphingomonas sp. PB2P12]|uniref:LytTR family DNA-binding domain-containing protein n=1 Tax=Sphingomonas sandaracina TaxID=3096157 RepID=UPI002FC7CB6D